MKKLALTLVLLVGLSFGLAGMSGAVDHPPDHWYSSHSADVWLFKNVKWKVGETALGDWLWYDNLTFKDSIEMDEKGHVRVPCAEYTKSGYLYYTDLPDWAGGGKGYWAWLAYDGSRYSNHYYFKIQGYQIVGYYREWYRNGWDGSPKPMVGHCVKGDCISPARFFVFRLYRYCLDRAPDTAGIRVYTQYLQNRSTTGSYVARAFLTSTEFLNRNLDDNDFLNVLYLALFGRDADAGGHADWMGQLAAGLTRQEVIDAFLQSTEWYNLCDAYGIEP